MCIRDSTTTAPTATTPPPPPRPQLSPPRHTKHAHTDNNPDNNHTHLNGHINTRNHKPATTHTPPYTTHNTNTPRNKKNQTWLLNTYDAADE